MGEKQSKSTKETGKVQPATYPSKESIEEAGPSSTVARKALDVKHPVMEPKILVKKAENSILHADVVYEQNFHMTKVHSSPCSGEQSNPKVDAPVTEELNRILNMRAREVCGEVTLPIELNLSVKFEKLELKAGVERSLPDLDDEGHYTKREDFEELFMRPCQGNILVEDIFDRALQCAIDEANYTTNNDKARAKFIRRHSQIVALIGQAGIGKTTLTRRITQLILKQKFLPNTEYIFFIPFREVDFSCKCTLFRFLVTGCELGVGSKFDKISKSWIDALQTNPSVVFIFDGLDEANTDQLSERNDRYALTTFCKPHVIVKKIFSGDIFPLAKKLVTSRPRQFFELHQKCRPRFAIDILGLNKLSQDKLGMQICQDNYAKVKEFLFDHPDVSSSLYVPVKCIIIFGVLYLAESEDSQTTVRSLTDIFVQALDHFLRTDHVREKANEVWKLADLAWNGFLRRKIIFGESEIIKARISKDAFQAFLHTVTEKNVRFSILDGDKRNSFTHLIWQELFAAINAMFLLPVDDFGLYLDEITKPLWEVVSKFMFGLCHPATRKKVDAILPPETGKELNDKKSKLYDLVLKLMKGGFRDVEAAQLMQICSWIQEAGDPQLESVVLQYFPGSIKLKKSILPSDISSLTYVMKKVNKSFSLEAINLGYDVNFFEDSLQRLLVGLANLQKEMEFVNLSWTAISDGATASLAAAITNIKKVRLCNCRLSSSAMTAISKKLSSCKQSIKMLDLSWNPIDDVAAASLADAIINIKDLRLCACRLSSIAITEISKKISSLKQPMEMLDLSANVMDDVSVIALAGAVANIKKLDVEDCELGRFAKEIISERCSLHNCELIG